MFKAVVIFLLLFLISPSKVFAQTNSFVSVVNPVRGEDFWEEKQQKIEDAVLGQIAILKRANLSATWLIRFDSFGNRNVIEKLKNSTDEKGLFLEITPTWSNAAGVHYHESNNWHEAGSAFLSGYEREERIKFINSAFEQFNKEFSFYPKSVGAWWIDSFSLEYMQKKYGITSALIVADQYTTDNYQIWGQYFGTPYYPAKNNALHPARELENKLPVVLVQWAGRDPVNGYGDGVMQSTFSVQANDYLDYHSLDTNYFAKLVDIYTNLKFNQFGHLVIGLENSYEWLKYKNEYENQIKLLSEKQKKGQLRVVSLREFATWYIESFPGLSPEHVIVADDPLGTYKKVLWFMNPYYRAGWFFNEDGSVFRDIRQYRGGEEPCFINKCFELNFATSASRVLDDVTYGHKWVLDSGKITEVKITRENENYILSYRNEAGNTRLISFLPKDLGIDGKNSSIDGVILNVTENDPNQKKGVTQLEKGSFEWSIGSSLLKLLSFLGFVIFCLLIPGFNLTSRTLREKSFYQAIFLSVILGLVELTLIFYILSLINLGILIYPYLLVNFLLFLKNGLLYFRKIRLPKIESKTFLLIVIVIILGTVFQAIPSYKNGLIYPYGLGFWGPNTHDGIWHLSLISELKKAVPPENPIFAETTLKNYHFFYDLLVATTNYLVKIPVLDLVFRFYPILFSALLGIGSYFLFFSIFEKKLGKINSQVAFIFSLYLIYFAGSFGWIVTYLKERKLAGESAFWANQSISFNLNPPFAISLLITISIMILLFSQNREKKNFILAIILTGSLIGFKAYAAVLIIATLLLVGIIKRKLEYLIVFIISLAIAGIIFLLNFQVGASLLMFAPFWFVHSMIDSPDRVGWVRLTLARTVGFESRNLFKYFSTEVIALIIFILGNLGTRVVALLGLIKLGEVIRNFNLFLVTIFAFLALLIPILFIQAGNPWNTVQFTYYFLYISALLGGYVFAQITTKVPVFLELILIVVFIIITPINSWATANSYLSYNPHAFVSAKEFEGLSYLKSLPEGVVLTYPFDPKLKNRIAEPWPILIYDSTSYVSAFSEKAVFIEDEQQNQILLTDYNKRLVASKDFFQNPPLEQEKILELYKIRYIYMPKIFKVRLDETGSVLKNIFENEEVVIYEVKKS